MLVPINAGGPCKEARMGVMWSCFPSCVKIQAAAFADAMGRIFTYTREERNTVAKLTGGGDLSKRSQSFPGKNWRTELKYSRDT